MKIEVTYNLTDLRELAKQFPDVVMEETQKVMDVVIARITRDVEAETPRGVGGDAGLAGDVLKGGDVQTVGMRVTGILGVSTPYGEVIELGRRPGKAMPPVDALMPWVRSILGISDPKEQKSVAFLVARKIGKKGFEGAHMFQKAWEKDQGWIQDQLMSIGPRVVKRVSK